MARLCRNLPPGHWHDITNHVAGGCIDVDDNGAQTPAEKPCKGFRQQMDIELDSLQALPRDRVWKTPVADGHAYYYIRGETPLVLLHVPYSDRWQAHPALLRGITLADIRQQIDLERRIEDLFQPSIT